MVLEATLLCMLQSHMVLEAWLFALRSHYWRHFEHANMVLEDQLFDCLLWLIWFWKPVLLCLFTHLCSFFIVEQLWCSWKTVLLCLLAHALQPPLFQLLWWSWKGCLFWAFDLSATAPWFWVGMVVLGGCSSVPPDLLHTTPASVIGLRVLKKWAFSKQFPFRGSGGPERTEHVWCWSVHLFTSGHTPRATWCSPDSGTWQKVDCTVTDCHSFCCLQSVAMCDCMKSLVESDFLVGFCSLPCSSPGWGMSQLSWWKCCLSSKYVFSALCMSPLYRAAMQCG